jgi:topoisomerase-4 subunit A
MPKPRIKKEFVVDLSEYDVKGRGTGGNLITKHSIRSVRTIKGTEAPVPIPSSGKNGSAAQAEEKQADTKPVETTDTAAEEEEGKLLFWDKRKKMIGFKIKGEEVCRLSEEDRILLLYDDGSYITYKGQNTLEVGDGIVYINKLDPRQVFSAVYMDGNSYSLYGKRFRIVSHTDEKYYYYISDYEDSELKFLTAVKDPIVDIQFKPLKGNKRNKMTVILDEKHFPLKKVSHIGERITAREVRTVKLSQSKQLSLI